MEKNKMPAANLNTWRSSSSERTDTAKVSCFFTNLEEELINKIQDSEAVVGCVAWLTNTRILQAMSSKNVSIVIQNESFLAPFNKCTRRDLREAYRELANEFHVDAVRLYGDKKKGIKPLMHHKFLVTLKQNVETCNYEPYGVWTGSFNLTKNATMSLENAVFIESTNIAKAYYQEWEQIYSQAHSFK